mmetsp:Transcript_35900/g.40828  ORF Transcript_35900/g.40828 Transcript_35900/m.40828 type:complete len:209 (+) Transcript_35900:910-1536(+)
MTKFHSINVVVKAGLELTAQNLFIILHIIEEAKNSSENAIEFVPDSFRVSRIGRSGIEFEQIDHMGVKLLFSVESSLKLAHFDVTFGADRFSADTFSFGIIPNIVFIDAIFDHVGHQESSHVVQVMEGSLGSLEDCFIQITGHDIWLEVHEGGFMKIELWATVREFFDETLEFFLSTFFFVGEIQAAGSLKLFIFCQQGITLFKEIGK